MPTIEQEWQTDAGRDLGDERRRQRQARIRRRRLRHFRIAAVSLTTLGVVASVVIGFTSPEGGADGVTLAVEAPQQPQTPTAWTSRRPPSAPTAGAPGPEAASPSARPSTRRGTESERASRRPPRRSSPPAKTTQPEMTPTQPAPSESVSAPPTSRAGFPDSTSTGVPAGTSLTPYTGPCTITKAGSVISGKNVSCGLIVRASDVIIRNSKLSGVTVPIDSGGSVMVLDSDIVVAPNETGIGDVNFVLERSDVSGGNRGVYCYDNCTVRDSYIHGTRYTGDAHASAMRAGQRTLFEGNTVVCDAPDNDAGGGCSANITMYGDYSTVHHVTIDGNLFKATTGGFCGYGGSSKSKPYPNAHHVVYTNNVFERGKGGKCGYWGAVTDFSRTAEGNVWSGNTWDDGSIANPS